MLTYLFSFLPNADLYFIRWSRLPLRLTHHRNTRIQKFAQVLLCNVCDTRINTFFNPELAIQVSLTSHRKVSEVRMQISHKRQFIYTIAQGSRLDKTVIKRIYRLLAPLHQGQNRFIEFRIWRRKAQICRETHLSTR